jgi:hypothetical protein
MKVSDTSGNFENPPAGTHLARCIGLAGIGTKENEFQGKKRWRNVVVITWELPYELRQDGQPFICSSWYTRSLSDKATLRHDLEAWRTKQFTKDELKGFEMRNLLDKGCQVIIAENDEGKTKVTGVAALPKGTTLPDRVNETKYFDIYEFESPDFEDALSSLSDKMQELVKESREYQEVLDHGKILTDEERRDGVSGEGEKAAAATAGGYEDDIPF